MLMLQPPLAQALDHGRAHGHEAGVAALALAHVQARLFGAALVQVAHLHGHRLAHPQAAMIDQFQAHPQARLAHGVQHGGHFLAREHHGQNERLGEGC
jgi:hypothetical protein